MARDDDFEPRLGRIGDRGKGQGRVRAFPADVIAATRRTSSGTIGQGGARRGKSFGRGRVSAERASSRRVVVKARIVRHQGARFRAASLRTHLYYLRRGGAGRDDRPGEAFDRHGVADHEAFASRCEPDRHHFRFIVSPEDADRLADLRASSCNLMAQMERDLGTRLDWIAVDHWNTDNPHVHVLVRGVADDGADLVISRDYISRGLRQRAEALMTEELGPRTQKEIDQALDREVTAERWTSLDRNLRDAAVSGEGVADLRPVDQFGPGDQRRLIGRAQVLGRYGLAEETAPGRWRLADDLEARLRELSLRGDIIKSLHKAMGAQERDAADLVIQGDQIEAPIVGRLVDRGLYDELNGEAFVVLDGADGRLHHVRFKDLGAAGDTPVDGLVEVRGYPSGAYAGVQLIHRSDLSIEKQVSAEGATWLDRQFVVAEPTPLARRGFGAEVRDALASRQARLVERDLGQVRNGRFEPVPRLIAKLRDEELARVKADLGARAGAAPAGEGEMVAGVYVRRLDLASGRFAMIDDGMGFQLVPWTRALESEIGREVRGTVTKTGIDWALGKKRGLGL